MEFARGRVVVDAPRRDKIYLPGSFNPLHEGEVHTQTHAHTHTHTHTRCCRRANLLRCRHLHVQAEFEKLSQDPEVPHACVCVCVCVCVRVCVGHTELLQAAYRLLNGDKEAAFELSVGNPDKV